MNLSGHFFFFGINILKDGVEKVDMRIEPINHLNDPINPQRDFQAIAQAGSRAGQVEKVKSNIHQNTTRNLNPQLARNNEVSPHNIHNSPMERAMKLLDAI